MLVKSNHTDALNIQYASKIELYAGETVVSLLSQESFLEGWRRLYNYCPWATVFQGHEFLNCWYQTYYQKFQPILIARYERSYLTGLLALACDEQKKLIFGAGRFEAEYQVWLSEPSQSDSFIKAALTKVQNLYPGYPIQLRYISAKVPLNWVYEPGWKEQCVVQASRCPLMEVRKISVDKITSKTGFRGKLNRLKRLGIIEFEHVTQYDRFDRILNELTSLCDFRQGARFNLNQFRDDPAKIDLYRSLFKRGLLYVAVLKVQRRIFAAVIAFNGEGSLYLSGMIVHAPFYARYCSPGFLNLIFLTQQLVKEDIAVFDLSPGGDAYKDRMATKQETVYELVVTNSATYRFKRQLKKQVYKMLEKAGKWPMGSELAFKKQLYLFKAKVRLIRQLGLMQTLAYTGRKITGKDRGQRTYMVYADQLASLNKGLNFQRDCLQDLLCFEANDTGPTRWTFLEEAMHRYEAGQSSFTFCEKGVLLACMWLDQRSGTMPVEMALGEKKLTSSVLHGFYCHPKMRDQYSAFIASVVAVLLAKAPFTPVHALSTDNNLCNVLEAIGFNKTDPLLKKDIPAPVS